MMYPYEFKDNNDAQEWNNISKHTSERNLLLREYVQVLGLISIMLGFGAIVITSYIRLGKKTSCHYYGWAVDIRTRDKPEIWYFCMVSIGRAIELLNPRFRMNPHFNTRDSAPHLHIEIRAKK